jgi:hypothetical protein
MIALEEWLCYYDAFDIVVMIGFGTTMSKSRAKSEDMSSMFEIVGIWFIKYSATVSMVAEPGLLWWEKPSPGWVKCNDDVAFVIGSETISVGLCFRDSNDQFMVDMTLARVCDFNLKGRSMDFTLSHKKLDIED